MAFDDIPEDMEHSEPCECGGTITQDESGVWRCDTCDWNSETGAEVRLSFGAPVRRRPPAAPKKHYGQA